MDKTVELYATLPKSRTAIAFTGEGDSKISLDTDAQQIARVMAVLLEMRGKLLKATFEIVED